MKPNEMANPYVNSTPIKSDISTTLPFTTTQRYRVESCSAMADEIRKYLIGPMPSSDFLNDFFPVCELYGLGRVPMFKPGCYDKVLIAKKEKNAYAPFVSFFFRLTLLFSYIQSPIRFKPQKFSLQAFALLIHPRSLIAIPARSSHSRSNLT